MGIGLILPDGVFIHNLKIMHNEKGDVLHAIKSSSPGFCGFGEAYFSVINSGETKGWKKHKKMTMNLCVPVGEIEFYLYSEAIGRTTTITLGEQNYQRLTIPPGIWVAFRGSSKTRNILLNVANLEHDPSEAENIPLESFAL